MYMSAAGLHTGWANKKCGTLLLSIIYIFDSYWPIFKILSLAYSTDSFYTWKQLLLSAHLSHHNSVHPSVRHTGGSVKNGASYDYQLFTVGCLEDSSFRNRKAFP